MPSRTAREARYVALLRGVSPMNAKMPQLKRCFEEEGFTDVRTVLASGNVVFSAPRATNHTLEARIEAAMQARLPQSFLTIVRPIDAVSKLLASEPWKRFRLPADAKRVVTFLQRPPAKKPSLPDEIDGVRVLTAATDHILTAYVPHPRGPVFMALLEKTYGKAVSTRTWETVEKIVRAAMAT